MGSPNNIETRMTPAGMAGTAILLTAGFVAAAVLFLFNPVEHGFYPQCLFHQMTGLDCPGCGSLRALHQLSHGHLVAALRFNPLLVLLLPAAAWMGFRAMIRQTTGRQLPGWTMAVWGWWALLAVIIFFGIARNLAIFGGIVGR